MLQTIRDRSQGLIVAVIVGLIILTFALWGIESYVSAGREVVVAEAEGEEILLRDFQEYLQRYRRQAQATLGADYDEAEWNSSATKQRVLDQLIDDRLLRKLVAEHRIRVSDAQVAQQIHQIPAFHDDNGFSRAVYEQRLPLLGLSQARFEQDLRADMAQAQLRAGIAASEFIQSTLSATSSGGFRKFAEAFSISW